MKNFKSEKELETEAKKLFDASFGVKLDWHTFLHAFKLGYYAKWDDSLLSAKTEA